MTLADHEQLIISTAGAYALRSDVLLAQVNVESSGNPWAWNPEPHYRYLWNVHTRKPFRQLTQAERDGEAAPADFPCLAGDADQEWWAQQASWGLLQILGAVAREYGYSEPFLTRLCDPVIGLAFGAKYLKACLHYEGGDYRRALARYNGGAIPNAAAKAYAVKVLDRAETLRKDA